ncbi:MAG: hypothetical protein QMA93_01500, partial [Acidimicrobiales bacterium]
GPAPAAGYYFQILPEFGSPPSNTAANLTCTSTINCWLTSGPIALLAKPAASPTNQQEERYGQLA